ncbi:nucleoside diphosphate-linked moiety X motif 6 isoform X2 [Tribolium castaneum]|nr:PREDICTED: nucleoside diphosphate-linked moiety X motif 6 isoform X2 [Tribolium castaneum]|eukprot:XP_008197132.1 PREDICTED: nucleoside diphosphate-linked moiety X motif 6 isoform X2 [Tribolium castaneum]
MANSGNKMSDIFEGTLDRFKGVTVRSEVENCDPPSLANKIDKSLKKWRESGYRGVWFRVHLDQSDWVPVLAKKGFRFHHAKDDFVMMYLWLPVDELCNIPPYAHTMIGVGAVVVNDKSEILVVSEKYYQVPHWKLPGGYVEPGENLVDAAIREVWEETGVQTEFHSVLTLRHTHFGMFGCSDIYTVVSLKPLTFNIEKCEREIAKCTWMDIEEYLNHPNVHELNRFFVQKYLEHLRKNLKIDWHHGIHQVLKKAYTVYFVTDADEGGKNAKKDD